MGKKYIIELEEKMFSNGTLDALYRVKGFRSLVFDAEGLAKLTPYEPEQERPKENALHTGDEVRYRVADEYYKCVVLDEANEAGVWVVLTEDGCVAKIDGLLLGKTGKHYPEVTKLIERLRS